MTGARPWSRASRISRVRRGVGTVLVAASLVGSGAAGAVTGASAGALTPAPAAAPAATSISIRTVEPAIDPGRTGVVVGNLQVDGLPDDVVAEGRELALEAQAKGEAEFTPVGTAIAGPGGNVRLVVRPEVTTRYRWTYAGAEDARPSTSGVARLRVRTSQHPARRLSTSLSVRAVPAVVAPGRRALLRGTLRSAHRVLAGRTVVLLARTAAEPDWQFAASRRTGRRGQVRFVARPEVPTTYQLGYAGSVTYRPATSAVVDVDVRPKVTIVAEPAVIEPGESTLVAGSVVHAGSAVAGATVELRARTGSGSSWAVADTAPTAADGSVSFTVSPAGTTRYRLRVAPAAGLPAGWSRAVEVQVREPGTSYRRSYTG